MNKFKRTATLVTFLVTLESILYLTSKHLVELDLVLLICLPFASSLAARSIAYLDIFEWLRAPFTVTSLHSSGVGNCVDPRPEPIRGVVGGLLSCVNCAGMWSTVGLLALLAFVPEMGRVTIIALGLTSIGILFSRVIELVEWQAHEAHEHTGVMAKENNPITMNASCPPPRRTPTQVLEREAERAKNLEIYVGGSR